MSGRILIKDGLIIDPSQKLEGIRDVLLAGGKVAAVGAGLSRQ